MTYRTAGLAKEGYSGRLETGGLFRAADLRPARKDRPSRASPKGLNVTTFSNWQYRDRTVPLAKIERLRRLAWLIDAAGRLPGTRFRFGLNSVIGLAPGAGDAILTLISLYIVYEAARLGLPRAKIVRMLANVAVEAGLGVVPLLGDLLDVVWKANLRNVAIIDEHFGMVTNAR